MRLKKILAGTVAAGALVVGTVTLVPPAAGAAQQGWRYHSSYERWQDCNARGNSGLVYEDWHQFRCIAAGDSWDLVYR